jgi:hypothetical protein
VKVALSRTKLGHPGLAVGLILTTATVAALVLTQGVGAQTVGSATPAVDMRTPEIQNQLSGVSCPTVTFCDAGGSYWAGVLGNGTDFARTLIEASAASGWSIVKSPNQPTAAFDYVNSISCATTRWCVAVGWFEAKKNSLVIPLIEDWNGKTWSSVPSGIAAKTYGPYLDGVSCVSASFCVAVGSSNFIESWNGKVWSVAKSPSEPNAVDAELNGVSCTSATSCVVVGLNGGDNPPVIDSWNGATWSSSDPRSSGDAGLFGVSCASASSCTAVGTHFKPGDVYAYLGTLIESWNGTVWSVVPSPHLGFDGRLNAVSCVSDTTCTAVGYDNSDPGPALIESSHNSIWSVSAGPNTKGPTRFARLSGISCASKISCEAVGRYSGSWFGPPPPEKTLIDSWNGTTWSVASSSNVANG